MYRFCSYIPSATIAPQNKSSLAISTERSQLYTLRIKARLGLGLVGLAYDLIQCAHVLFALFLSFSSKQHIWIYCETGGARREGGGGGGLPPYRIMLPYLIRVKKLQKREKNGTPLVRYWNSPAPGVRRLFHRPVQHASQRLASGPDDAPGS